MQIYLNLLMNTGEKEKGILLYFKAAGNTAPDTILVEKTFWFNPTYTFWKPYESPHKPVLWLLKWSHNFK